MILYKKICLYKQSNLVKVITFINFVNNEKNIAFFWSQMKSYYIKTNGYNKNFWQFPKTNRVLLSIFLL